MLPLLQYASDGEVHSLREAIEALADRFNLSEQARQELLPSGKQALFANRVGWARTHLFKVGLLQSSKRGFFQITDRYAKNINLKIVLVDGQKLAQLMIDYGVGVSTSEIYEIKKIDSDYFIEE
ncbi:winged helix-turn-helix domain-containing protein [Leptolyngbya sp. FACHB-1515]